MPALSAALSSGPRCTVMLAVRCRRSTGLFSSWSGKRLHHDRSPDFSSASRASLQPPCTPAVRTGQYWLSPQEASSWLLVSLFLPFSLMTEVATRPSGPWPSAVSSSVDFASLHFINGFPNPLFAAAWSFTYAVFCSVEEISLPLPWNTDSRPNLRLALPQMRSWNVLILLLFYRLSRLARVRVGTA